MLPSPNKMYVIYFEIWRDVTFFIHLINITHKKIIYII